MADYLELFKNKSRGRLLVALPANAAFNTRINYIAAKCDFEKRDSCLSRMFLARGARN
jgi:hypothetical protein